MSKVNDFADHNGSTSSVNDGNTFNVNSHPFIDELKYHSSTLKTHNAHLKKLQKLGINLLSLTDETINDQLMQIKKSGADSKELSNNYINGIYATIRRLRPSLTKTRRELGLHLQNNPNSIYRDQDTFMGTMKMLLDIVKDITETNILECTRLRPRRIVDTQIAIVLTLLTNLRSSELMQLQVKHINMIDRELPLSIQTKHRNTSIKILRMGKLFDGLYPQIVKLALHRDKLYNSTTNSNFSVTIKQNTVVQNTFLISCKIDTINKVLREFYERSNKKKPPYALGLKSIRTLNTTIMITHNELLLAQTLNRHRDLNVTLKHYNSSCFEEKIADAYVKL
ncbi:GSCOCT00011558001.2-RA-CDS [Cotesia congregata]|nr:GSCOCT00011558001.2-RA-CDS [Cotesia congregata]